MFDAVDVNCLASSPRLDETLGTPDSPSGVGSHVHLADIWRRLTAGKCRVLSILTTERQTLALMEEANDDARWSLPRAADVAVVELILLGRTQKAVALETDRSPSTISAAARQCLSAMGSPILPSRVPLLFVLAVHALHGFAVSTARVERAGLNRFMLTTERVDTVLHEHLPAAEWQAASMLIEGQSYLEMAEKRRTSPRTIANQLAAVFRKLGVSGRAELLAKIARGELGRLGQLLGH